MCSQNRTECASVSVKPGVLHTSPIAGTHLERSAKAASNHMCRSPASLRHTSGALELCAIGFGIGAYRRVGMNERMRSTNASDRSAKLLRLFSNSDRAAKSGKASASSSLEELDMESLDLGRCIWLFRCLCHEHTLYRI